MPTKRFKNVKKGDWLTLRGALIVAASDAVEIEPTLWRFKVEQPAYCDNVDGEPTGEIELADVIPRATVREALAALRAEMAAVANGSTTALMPGTVELVAKSSASYWMTRVGGIIAKLGLDAAQEKSV